MFFSFLISIKIRLIYDYVFLSFSAEFKKNRANLLVDFSTKLAIDFETNFQLIFNLISFDFCFDFNAEFKKSSSFAS